MRRRDVAVSPVASGPKMQHAGIETAISIPVHVYEVTPRKEVKQLL